MKATTATFNESKKPSASQISRLQPAHTGLLQRKCACGGTPGPDGECAACKARRLALQRQALGQAELAAPTIVRAALRSLDQPLESAARAFGEPGLGHDFSNMRIHAGIAERLQTKLAVGQPGDVYEQEANRVADQVMRMPDPDMTGQTERSYAPHIQRIRAMGEERMRRQLVNEKEEEEQTSLQGKEAAGYTPEITPCTEAHIESIRGQGQPLPESERSFFEPRFRHDFSDVRIHTDQRAAESARAINALAYTVGRDIVFGARQFAPDTATGKSLLAHELTHVVQQQSQAPEVIQSPPEEANANPEVRMRTELSHPTIHQQSVPPTIQRDLARVPPHPAAAGRVLTPVQMAAAIAFNNHVVGPGGADLIREIRDVLGTSPTPAVIDDDFVNAVVRWQAMQGLTQDGQLGPLAAAPLFREIGAEGAGKCRVVSGPTYHPMTALTPPPVVAGGGEQAIFTFDAEFANDPANGEFASCCEVHQFIRWNPAFAAAAPGGPPHGFPAGAAADTWIEDRDAAGLRYGHRSGPFSENVDIDHYSDNTGRNLAFGHLFHGRDTPQTPRGTGEWRFFVQAFDVCSGKRVGSGDAATDYLTIRW